MKTRPGVVPDDSTDARLPLHEVLDALDEWQASPSAESLEPVRTAFEHLLDAKSARGAYISVDAPPLPRVGLGVGSLETVDRSDLDDRLARFELRADRGRIPLGTLWLDGGLPQREAQAARAVETALDAGWARAEAARAAARMEALDVATQAIAGVLSVDRTLQVIVDQVRPLVGAQYAALGIVDAKGHIEQFITSGITDEERRRIGPLPHGRGLLGLIIRENRSFLIPDISTDPRRYGFPEHHPEMHSFLGVPVSVKGRSVGRLYLTNKQGATEFSADDQGIVETFARHAAIAIENARLHEQVSHLAVMEERERIGADLHDGIIQSIYAVGLSLEDVPELMEAEPSEAVQRVEQAIDRLHMTIRDIRGFIFGLRPELLTGTTLVTGLAALVEEFRHNTMIDVELRLPDPAPELPPAETAELLAIAHEALSNVGRHSQATQAWVELYETDTQIELNVGDNGVGFTPRRSTGLGHQGLPNMRSRAEKFGGSLDIQSATDQGTRVIVQVPKPDRAHG